MFHCQPGFQSWGGARLSRFDCVSVIVAAIVCFLPLLQLLC